MKFTSEDLMKAMGLQVGDRIHLFEDKARDFDEGIYQIIKEQSNDYPTYYVFENINDSDDRYSIKSLIDLDFEILPRQKRVGDLECNHDCGNCPLRILPSCKGCGIKTLYKILEAYKMVTKDEDYFDQEIHDLLKARLDKEVE